MLASPQDLAQVRLDNALALFEEFVRAMARHADAATLRGLERRFAERIDIQPSYWSQIKGRSRQIGERLARQFEQRCNKPAGWMDVRHDAAATLAGMNVRPDEALAGVAQGESAPEFMPRDDDERFIVGLVLTYYRRHPQRARGRLLDLLGEVLTPTAAHAPDPPATASRSGGPGAPGKGGHAPQERLASGEDARDLWLRSQSGVAPLKRKK